MIQLVNNELQLNDGTYYDLSKISRRRALQGLNHQLQKGSLTKDEYEQCINLINESRAIQMEREKVIEPLNDLEEICGPVIDYLIKNYDPHCSIIISDNQIKLIRTEVGIPVNKVTAQEVPVQEQSRELIIKIDGNTIATSILETHDS